MSQPTKVRPIQRFAEAAGRCTTEVCETRCPALPTHVTNVHPGHHVRQVYFCRLQQCVQRQVRQGVHGAEGLLPGMARARLPRRRPTSNDPHQAVARKGK
ncbi:hypothetical protein FH972_023688 [Carpinus fangiana]|uniref:Uncharacterized protein n=1 Tax=Carpinus fangiana TaxID=176857 RepID=A0A5N6KYD0_9ROSI|nr:hypothetical protein FH972_023688 [Carpinus fangiana]